MSSIGNKDIMSKNLKFYIEKSGKSRQELAEIWGFPYSTLTEWVNGRKYPRIDKIEIMADYFGILKSDLIEDKAAEVSDKFASLQLFADRAMAPFKPHEEAIAATGYKAESKRKNLTLAHEELIQMVERIPAEKVEWVLSVMKSILADE